MPRTIDLPPTESLLPDGCKLGGWWHDDPTEEGRIVCDLCPRDCHLRPGDRGFCFVRENRGGQMVLSTYGRSTGFCIDPIEKKPLNHFYPGTSVLSFGTAGCNLACKFCQNWSISKSREIEQLSEEASPAAIARAAQSLGCKSVAFTYNDPVIWAEYAIDVARACRDVGVKTVAVTAGYITAKARPAFYEHMDAANVDLKGFTEEFYRHLTLSHIEPVKETLKWLVHESPVWTEITNLIIPRENDSADELKTMCDWILEALGPDVPVHFTAFHPDFRLLDRERTPAATLVQAQEIARRAGLHFAYVGNVQSRERQSTYCPQCRGLVIERTGYELGAYALDGSHCRHCGASVAGHFDRAPGHWGSRRQPVQISAFEVRPQHELAVVNGPPVPNASAARATMHNEPHTDPPHVPPSLDSLTADQERAILRTCTRLLAASVAGDEGAIDTMELVGLADLPVLGSFVSLKRQAKLRSCCGFLGQEVPLAKALAHAGRRTASEDHRFPPVTLRELPFLEVEVWLLHNMQPVTAHGEARRSAVEIGRHGLQIARGDSRGLLLPGVAIDADLSAEEFLQHVCLKAELPPTAWREPDTALWTFEGHAIRGTLEEVEPVDRREGFSLADKDLAALVEFCRGNILSLLTGATPNYFALGLADGNVHGVVLSLRDAAGRELLAANRLSLRNSLPLQSTLYSLTENVAVALRRSKFTAASFRELHLALAILAEPAMHGTLAEPDLRGCDPAQHALLVLERGQTAVTYDTRLSAESLLEATAGKLNVATPEAAAVFTFSALSSASELSIVHVPRPAAGQALRPPGVAGKFYPADPQELNSLVEACLPKHPVQPSPWPAVMVPHAGLVYSGRIAAETLRRVRFPKTAIVIGPKHTPYGVEWAVAPHETWSLPGLTLPADPELARRLAQAIPGLQLDAAAHAQEHAIEVELPFFARLAPQTKVLGVAIGGGDLERCRHFAAGLAKVIRTLPEQPLLVISSDMNHFASDAENRRLDEIALRAMESLDAEQLYHTVRRQHISMCGLLPAVIVIETLRELGQLGRAERVAYATSADVSGDKSRVVGYAGMLLGP